MNLKTTHFLVLAFCLSLTIQASEDNINSPSTIINNYYQDNDWKSVYNKDGLIIFLKEETLPEGRFIAYKYENKSSKEISFSLKLIQNGEVVPQNEKKITIKGNSSETFFDPTDTFQLTGNESINNFSVEIN